MNLIENGRVLQSTGFIYCASQRTLAIGDTTHHLNSKTSQVLQLLVDAAGDIVSRGELIDKVWDDNFLVGDKGLSTAIWNIRKCFKSGSDTAVKLSIETIPKKGYRLNILKNGQHSLPAQTSLKLPINVFTTKNISMIALTAAIAVALTLLVNFLNPKDLNVTVVVDGDKVTRQIETTQ